MSRRRQTRNAARLITAGAVGLLVIGMVLYLSVTSQNGLPWARYYVIHVRLTDAGDLDTYDDVRVAGRRIGQVAAIRYEHGFAEVTLQIDQGDAPLRQGSIVLVRLSGLIGAEFVQITPALHGRPLPSGATIGVSQTHTNPDLFDVLSAFSPPIVRDLRATIRAVGIGFLGRGQGLNQAIADGPPLERAADPLLASLNAEPQAVRSFIPSLDALADAVAPARFNIVDGFVPEARALKPLADNGRALGAIFTQAPGALTAATAQLPSVDALLDQTDGLARAVRALTRPAPAALRATAQLLEAAPTPIRNATGLLAASVPLVPAALRLIDRVNPLAAPLEAMLADSVPVVSDLGARACDLVNAAAWLRDSDAFGQAPDGPLGPHNVVRILVAGNADLVQGGPKLPSSQIKFDANPAPCTATSEVVGAS